MILDGFETLSCCGNGLLSHAESLRAQDIPFQFADYTLKFEEALSLQNIEILPAFLKLFRECETNEEVIIRKIKSVSSLSKILFQNRTNYIIMSSKLNVVATMLEEIEVVDVRVKVALLQIITRAAKELGYFPLKVFHIYLGANYIVYARAIWLIRNDCGRLRGLWQTSAAWREMEIKTA